MQKQLDRLGLSFTPKVRIARDFYFEKFMLQNPSRPKNRVAPVQLRQSFANIPIGVRGRKRKTMNVVFIGVAPNPDGRVLSSGVAKQCLGLSSVPSSLPTQIPSHPIVSNSVEQTQLVSETLFTKPAKRTYGRLMSTPFWSSAKANNELGKRSQARLVSAPLPQVADNHLLVFDKSTSSVDIDLDSNFGRLHAECALWTMNAYCQFPATDPTVITYEFRLKCFQEPFSIPGP